MPTSKYQKTLKARMHYNTLLALLSVSEMPENKKKELHTRMLHVYNELIQGDDILTEEQKDEAMKGQKAQNLYNRAKGYRSKIINIYLRLFKGCSPSGVSNVVESFEMLRKKAYVVHKKENQDKWIKKNPDLDPPPEPKESDCNKEWSHPLFYVFTQFQSFQSGQKSRMNHEKRLALQLFRVTSNVLKKEGTKTN